MTSKTPNEPNYYQLSGAHLHVSYATSGIDGKPHFSYQDAVQTLTFSGDQIRRVETDLGVVVSVSIRRTVDQGSTSFSLLVPRVRLSGHVPAAIQTEGITTLHRFSLVPAFDVGQQDLYTVTPMHGTAAFVTF